MGLPLGIVFCMLAPFCARSPAPPPRAEVARYHGSFLGVRARVQLNLGERLAAVELSGVPFGGTVRGTARFLDENGESGRVRMDGPLDRAMRARLCSVRAVALDEAADEVRVSVALPLFGTRALTLKRDV